LFKVTAFTAQSEIEKKVVVEIEKREKRRNKEKREEREIYTDTTQAVDIFFSLSFFFLAVLGFDSGPHTC
jgi:hypothetical protein